MIIILNYIIYLPLGMSGLTDSDACLFERKEPLDRLMPVVKAASKLSRDSRLFEADSRPAKTSFSAETSELFAILESSSRPRLRFTTQENLERVQFQTRAIERLGTIITQQHGNQNGDHVGRQSNLGRWRGIEDVFLCLYSF